MEMKLWWPLLLAFLLYGSLVAQAFQLLGDGCRYEGGRRTFTQRMSTLPDFDKSTQFESIGPLQREVISLETGLEMETLIQKPPVRGVGEDRPALVFVHGSFHGAWCWAEHWMPYFSSKGYRTYSISLRGTSGSPAAEGATNVKIGEHAADLGAYLRRTFPAAGGAPAPVVVAHSLAGVLLMKYLEDPEQAPLSGGAWLCSVPPSGNGPMTRRFLKDRPLAALKIVLGFVAKLATSWGFLARDLFFNKDIDKKTLNRYMENFKADSKIGLDLVDLTPKLPINCADENKCASWLDRSPPRFVLGAERDYIVDLEGLKELATFLDVEAELLRGAAHDVMLGPGWKAGAERLGRWLEGPALRRRRREEAQEGGGEGGGGGAAPPPSTGR